MTSEQSWVAQTFAFQKVCRLPLFFGMAEAPAGTSLLATCHSSLTTVLWGSEKPQTLENRSALQVCRHLSLFFGMAKARSWVAQTFASQKVCGFPRPEAAVTSDSQALIAFFGIAKSRRPWKPGLRYKTHGCTPATLFRPLSFPLLAPHFLPISIHSSPFLGDIPRDLGWRRGWDSNPRYDFS